MRDVTHNGTAPCQTARAMKLPRLQPGIDFLAGISMIAAATLIIWRLAFAAPATATPGRAALPTPSTPVSFAGAPIEGDPNAPIGIIQYSDFECPFCGKFARETLPTVREKYLNTGKAFLAFVHFPLESIHARAASAAAVSKCAQDRGVFWPFHDRLFASAKPALDDRSLAAAFEGLGLPPTAFVDCQAGDALDRVKLELAHARRLQVKSTPTFFFGLSLKDGTIRVRSRISGAVPVAAFEDLLGGLEKEGTPGKSGNTSR